jgi:hypothetical protein
MHVCVYIYIYIYIYINIIQHQTSTQTTSALVFPSYIHTYICIHTYIHTHTHTYIHTYARTHTYKYTHSWVRYPSLTTCHALSSVYMKTRNWMTGIQQSSAWKSELGTPNSSLYLSSCQNVCVCVCVCFISLETRCLALCKWQLGNRFGMSRNQRMIIWHQNMLMSEAHVYLTSAYLLWRKCAPSMRPLNAPPQCAPLAQSTLSTWT